MSFNRPWKCFLVLFQLSSRPRSPLEYVLLLLQRRIKKRFQNTDGQRGLLTTLANSFVPMLSCNPFRCTELLVFRYKPLKRGALRTGTDATCHVSPLGGQEPSVQVGLNVRHDQWVLRLCFRRFCCVQFWANCGARFDPTVVIDRAGVVLCAVVPSLVFAFGEVHAPEWTPERPAPGANSASSKACAKSHDGWNPAAPPFEPSAAKASSTSVVHGTTVVPTTRTLDPAAPPFTARQERSLNPEAEPFIAATARGLDPKAVPFEPARVPRSVLSTERPGNKSERGTSLFGVADVRKRPQEAATQVFFLHIDSACRCNPPRF